jgi:hypothetical protein
LPAPHRGGLGSIPGQVMWDLWWTKRQWDKFVPSISIIIIIIYLFKLQMGFYPVAVYYNKISAFTCQFLFHQMLHTHLSSGTGTTGQIAAEVPNGLSLNSPHGTKKNY